MGFAPNRYSVLNSPVWLRSHRPPARKRPLVDGPKRSLPFPKLEVVLRVLRGEALDYPRSHGRNTRRHLTGYLVGCHGARPD